MELKTHGPDTLVRKIADVVRAANDNNEVMYGVELSPEEYAQLRKELEVEDDDLTACPPSGIPVYVNGKSVLQSAVERHRLAMADEAQMTKQ